MNDQHPPLVLASTSPFRRELLQRLCIPFDTFSPEVDETPRPGEKAPDLVCRLSESKARAAAVAFPKALIIGSDQVAVVDQKILGKPGTHENARRQLQDLSGKCITFYTGLCLYDALKDKADTTMVPFKVHFRNLALEQIERYLQMETPYHCAGSFKSEALGITLFERLEGDDPNALIGLPLIELTRMLARTGWVLP